MKRLATLIATAATGIVLSTAVEAQVTLKASHQFPGGKGDVRDNMMQLIAKEAEAANVGLNVEVYPDAALFQAPLKVEQQWDAIVNGQLDITLLPLDYASDKVRAFSATLMPGLVRSQDRALRINQSQFMTVH
jgi:TRAP-type transport system periplasmic protein